MKTKRSYWVRLSVLFILFTFLISCSSRKGFRTSTEHRKKSSAIMKKSKSENKKRFQFLTRDKIQYQKTSPAFHSKFVTMKPRHALITFLSLIAFFYSIVLFTGCSSQNKSKGYNYEQHRKDNNERVKETRKRNKKSKSLLEHKGKSVKTPKPEYP